MEQVYIRLKPHECKALVDLAAHERRHPKDQGAVLVLEGLQRRGMLPEQPDRSAAEVTHAHE